MKWPFVFISLFGSYLNARKMILGFICWGMSDVYFCYHHLVQHEYDEACLFFVYLIFAMYGVWNWIDDYTE